MNNCIPQVQWSGRHTVVTMTLSMDGKQWSINQMGPDFLVLEATESHPPGHGMVHLNVNGRLYQMPVELPMGIAPDKRDTQIKAGHMTRKNPS